MYQQHKPDASVTESIRESLGYLYREDTDVVELRVFRNRKTFAGYFDDFGKLAEKAAMWDEQDADVYVTLNPCKDALLGRADNELKEIDPKRTPLTSDNDIEHRTRILVDCDPQRPSKVSSTDDEKEGAIERAREIQAWLRGKSIPAALADSGNGGHLLIPVNLPNDKESKDLVERFLKALSFRFSDEKIKVDEGTFNAARITKCYGVVARKGANVERKGRVHRRSRILTVPKTDTVAQREQLEAVAVEIPEAPKRGKGLSDDFDGREWLEEWLERYDVPIKRQGEWERDGYRWVLEECPWNGHADTSAYIVFRPGRGIGGGCHHDSCQGYGWRDLRQHFEPEAYSQNSHNSQKSLQSPLFANYANFANGKSDQKEEWEPPVPFYEFDLPPFPTDALPDWAADFVRAEARCTQTPEDLAGVLVLNVGALALAKVLEVEPWPGWTEPANLYTAVSMPPGSRKSIVFKHVTRPVSEFETKKARESAVEIAEQRTRRKIYEQRVQKCEQAAAKADGDVFEARTAEAMQASRDLQAIKVPTELKLLADDATPEKLASMMQEQGGRMALMSPEGDVFDIMAGRYSQGVPNLGIYLKGHAGDPLRVDRAGRESERVESPALTIGLTVQPDVLHGLTERPSFRGRGLLGRFLYSLPPNNLGQRETGEPAPVPPDTQAAYRQCVKALLELAPEYTPEEEIEPATLRLSEDAKAELKRFMSWLEPQLSHEGELGTMTDWAGKLAGAVVRIAGILHAMNLAGRSSVHQPLTIPSGRYLPASAIKQALHLADYFLAHARAAFAQMGADPVVEGAKHILAWIERTGVTAEFSKREAFEGTKGRFHKVSAMQPGLELLISHGHIKEQVAQQKGRGRPSERYEVNPLAGDKITRISHSQYSHNSQKS